MRKLTRRQQQASAALSLIALLFISLDFAGTSLAGAHRGATGALGSLYRGTDSVIGPVRRFIQGVPDVADNRSRIAALEQQNNDLRRQLAAAQADRATAARLGQLQLQSTAGGWSVMPARVIATGPGAGFERTLTVDVGRREHVLVGQTVTDGFALVGRVVSVYATTSVILLVSDPSSGVGVRDVRSGELLLAKGAGSQPPLALPLSDNATTGIDVKVGDHLVTGPAGQTTFVAGIEFGVVTKVSKSLGGVTSATVKPAAGQSSGDLLGIVLVTPRDSPRAAVKPDNN